MNSIPEQAVLEELRNISGSELFSGSNRALGFLDYIVREALAGNADKLKGYTIGLEVFDRTDDFDAEKSSVVRVEAQRLRHLLERYYLGEGRYSPLRIDLPKGRYVPEFTPQQSPPGSKAKAESSVAVLPLKNLSGDSAQQYIADGLTEELIVALGNRSEMTVMSSHATDGFEGKRISPQQVGRDLGVRFLVYGSVQMDKRQIRINLELVDAVTGEQIWSESYRRPFTPDDLFDVQEEMSKKLVACVADRYMGAIPRTLSKALLHRSPTRPTSYEATLYLHHYSKNPSWTSYRAARQMLEKASLDDPEQAMIWAALGELRLDGYAHFDMEQDMDVTINMALQCTAKARDLNHRCDYCYFVEGQAYIMARDPDKAIDAAETMLGYHPPPSSVALAGWLLALAGEWERGLGILRDQMEILRYHPKWLHHPFFLDHMQRAEYPEALTSAQAFSSKEFIWGPLERAAALGMLGRVAEGKRELADVYALRPDFAEQPRRYLECFIMQDERVDAVIEGLHRAGMPAFELRLVK